MSSYLVQRGRGGAFEQQKIVGERFSGVSMGSLVDQTEAALAGVLSLCSGSVGQQDVDALQRHDETALALLDINDDDSVEVRGSLRRRQLLSSPTTLTYSNFVHSCDNNLRTLAFGTTLHLVPVIPRT